MSHRTGPGPDLKRRHHTVPKFHLRRFADERDQLIRVELPGDHRHRIGVGDATVVRDFYMVEMEDGAESDHLEDAFGYVEGNAAGAFRKVLDDGIWPLDPESRTWIAAWAAIQHLRTPAIRAGQAEVADTVFKLQVAVGGKAQVRHVLEQAADGAPVTGDEVDAEWAKMTDFSSYAMTTHPNEHARLIAEMFPGVVRTFAVRGWGLARFARRSLVTCDTPIVLLPAADADPHEGVGITTAASVIVTLSRRAAVIMTRPELDDFTVPATTDWARDINHATIRNARRAVFHHPDDDPLAGLTLPSPRDSEMEPVPLDQFLMPDGWPSKNGGMDRPDASL